MGNHGKVVVLYNIYGNWKKGGMDGDIVDSNYLSPTLRVGGVLDALWLWKSLQLMIRIVLNPDKDGVATTLKADNFNWQHIYRPRGGIEE